MSLLSHRQIAEIMTARGYPMGKQRVYELERRALAKLRRELKDLADETKAADETTDLAAAQRRAQTLIERSQR